MSQQELFPPPAPTRAQRADAEVSTRAPGWMVWLESVMRFLVQFYLGVLMLALPWMTLWTQNNLFTYSNVLMTLGENGFIRGAFSGLGLLNILLALRRLLPRRR